MKNSIKALLLFVALTFSSASHAGQFSDLTLAAGVGAGSAYAFSLLPQPSPNPLGKRLTMILGSLLVSAAWEGLRAGVEQKNFDPANTYSSALGTLGVVTFKF